MENATANGLTSWWASELRIEHDRFTFQIIAHMNFGRQSRVAMAFVLCTATAFASRAAAQSEALADEPWLKERLERFQDLKFGFMMHFGAYSKWGCIESWPLVEEDKWARPDDLPAWVERANHRDAPTCP